MIFTNFAPARLKVFIKCAGRDGRPYRSAHADFLQRLPNTSGHSQGDRCLRARGVGCAKGFPTAASTALRRLTSVAAATAFSLAAFMLYVPPLRQAAVRPRSFRTRAAFAQQRRH